jgi:hypothetical protein
MEGIDRMTPLTLLDYPLDNATLLQSAENARLSAEPYTDSRYPSLRKEDWYIGRYTDKHVDKIMRDFEVDGSPRFYWLEPFADIPQHVDNGTQCSINLILTENPAPITVDGVDYTYRQALLNTALPHSVRNGEDERIMLKISMFDETYESLSARIKYKLEI